MPNPKSEGEDPNPSQFRKKEQRRLLPVAYLDATTAVGRDRSRHRAGKF
jgi:hypothetical protein